LKWKKRALYTVGILLFLALWAAKAWFIRENCVFNSALHYTYPDRYPEEKDCTFLRAFFSII
jgi:hypothetical protein